MTTERKFFSGDTEEQAILQAARHYGIEPEELAYRQIEKRHGFLKLRRNVVIEVDPSAPRRPAAADGGTEAKRPAAPAPAKPAGPPATPSGPPATPAERPARAAGRPAKPAKPPAERAKPAAKPAELPMPPAAAPGAPSQAAGPESRRRPETPRLDADAFWAPIDEAGPVAEAESEPEPEPEAAAETADLGESPRRSRERPPRATGPMAEAAREALQRLFELARLDLEAQVGEGEERLEIEVSGSDEEILLRDRGRVLFSLQHLVPRLIRGLTGESVPCLVDCDGFHEIREERLRDLAQRTASEVQQRGRSRTLEPMAPDERRIIHMTLADDPTVETESKGQGLFKRVTVRPQRRHPRGFDPYNR